VKVILVANTSWYIFNFRLPFIRSLLSRNIKVIVVSPKDEYISNLKTYGIHHIDISIERKGLNPFNDLKLVKKLSCIYKNVNPDFIHHFTIKPVIFGSIAARLAGIANIINTIPGLGYIFAGNTVRQKAIRILVKQLYKLALKKTIINLFQNPDDRDYFVNNNLIQKINTKVTFGSGVDLEHFTFSPLTYSKKGYCCFLLLGRLLRDKGVTEFVEAAKHTRRNFPNTRFVILGIIDRGNPEGINRKEIEEWDNQGIIEFLERRNDVRPIIQGADVVVLPSYYREGVPKSLIEAMAIGRPIITTDWPGCRETVVHRKNGILIPVKNVYKLIEAIKFMIDNPEERLNMGKESRKLAVKRFDVKRVNRMFLDAMGIS